MNYRKEIDGLRALAVLAIIFFHAGFEIFKGGYVGVDIFFVISGYLITTIILEEHKQKKFYIINFYIRRIRRILPALFFVTIFCIPFAFFFMLPIDMKNFSKSLIAVSFFSSNFLFWFESGYFDTVAKFKPLLHTWSLAIEEQYYIILPFFLIFFLKLGTFWIFAMLIIILLTSLILAQWAAYNMPSAAFYLLPTRIWELLIGTCIAFFLTKLKKKNFSTVASEVGSLLGLALILYSIFFFSKKTAFPGFYALVPTIGAAFIILFTTQRTLVGKLIGNKVFVIIGLSSYSSYLWHQPIFSFVRYKFPFLEHKNFTDFSQNLFFLLSILTLIIAYFTWKFVETPFRGKTFTNSKIIVFATLGTIIILVMGLVGNYTDGFKNRLPTNIAWQSLGEKLSYKGYICKPKAVRDFVGIKACEFGAKEGKKSFFLYGDSHADAIIEYLHLSFLKDNIKGIRVEIDNCEIVPNIINVGRTTDFKNLSCVEKFKSLTSFIKATNADIILISRWSFRLYPIKGYIDDMPYRNSEGGIENESYREYAAIIDNELKFNDEAKRKALTNFIEDMLETNLRLFLIYPVPEIAWDISRKNWEFYKINNSLLDTISIPFTDYELRNRFVTDVFESFSNRKNFYAVKPSDIFCNSFVKNRCVAQYKTVPFYYDDDHLSYEGSKLLIDSFLGIATLE